MTYVNTPRYVRVCCRCGTPVKRERHKGIDYPYYCPCCDENMYTVETELVKAVKGATYVHKNRD